VSVTLIATLIACFVSGMPLRALRGRDARAARGRAEHDILSRL